MVVTTDDEVIDLPMPEEFRSSVDPILEEKIRRAIRKLPGTSQYQPDMAMGNELYR